MKLDNIIDILISSIESGDCSIFFNNFLENDSSKENLDSIYIKLGEYISIFIDDLPQKEDLISNALQILTDLIQTFDTSSEDLALHLAKTVLLVITEEKCNITIIKRAIHVLNLIIQKPEIICAVVNDESLEGSLQILGRKVPSTGDYECQALMFEALYRITCNENREYWVNIWFSDPVARSMFMELDPQKFEANCRKVLNYINRNEPDRRVFSFLACSVTFGSLQLNEPYGCDLWIDFNYDSQSISFYCSEIIFEESAENSGMWETILISNSSVKYYSVKDRKSEKKREVILLLNCPCYTLITSSNITNPEFSSFEIRILIWEILDIHQHLEKIYGKDKYAPDFSDHKMPEVSVPTDVIRIDGGVSNVFPNEELSQRKISTISTPISVETCETEDVISGTEQNQNMSIIRKISESAERIHITTEVVAENLSSQGFRKISASSDVIELETSKVGEHIQKETRRRSSVSVDAIFYDPYIDGANNNSQEREIESSISSKEADNGEMIPKIHQRRIRLYNLDSAPVYDVPPLTSSSDPVSQDCINVSKESHAVISENRVNTHELTEDQRVESVQKTDTRRKRSSKSIEATEQRTTKGKQIRLYESFLGSDEDFQELVNRDTDKRRGEKSSATSATKNKQNITHKRKFEASPSYDPQSVKKPAKLPRRAAMKARRKTKEMLGSTSSIVTCDKIEVMNEYNEDRGKTLIQRSRKRKKLYKNNTDTDTLSSEVSWMKQNKSSFLFETPKKNYSEWRKSLHKKKALPVKIVPGSKSPEKKPPRKKRKKDISMNLSVESETKPKSLGLSDLENYNLTIEKNTKRNSYPAISALESNFQNISASGSKRYSFKESSHAHSHLGKNDTESDSDSIVKNISREQLKQVVQVLANDKMINDHGDMSKLSRVTKNKHADSISEIGISKTDHLVIPNKEHNLSNASNGDAEKGDSNCNKNYSCCDEVITLHNDHDELIQGENKEESKKNQSKPTLKNTSEQVIDCLAHGFKDYIQETKGKRLILKRFLECVAEYSETQNDSTRAFASEPEVDPHQISPHVSYKSLPTRLETVKSMEGSEFQSEGSKEMSLQPPSEEKADIVEHQNNGMKIKDKELSVFPTKVKKRKIISYSEEKREYSAVDNRVAEKVNFLHSRLTANPVIDSTACRYMESQKSADKAATVRTVPISIEHDGSGRSFTKHQHHKKSRDLNKSFNSIYSKLTTSSLVSSEKDKKWFETIIFVLSQDANILSRKLLATVQNCYFEFITKMNALREKIVKTVEEFEGSSSPNTSHYKLRYLVKKCRINRHEVEKSLQRMRNTGKEYFELEEKCFRRLKRKNVKASRKFISNMRRAEKTSVQKLEGKVFLKTKSLLKRLLKHIQSV